MSLNIHHKVKLKQLAGIISVMVTCAAAACTNSQVLIAGECIDCNAIFYGCTSCSQQSDDISSIQCNTCDFGLYLLSAEAATTSSQTMCMEACEDFGYNWVSNKNTMTCEYCGPFCTQCSSQYGCLENYKQDHGYRYIAATSYQNALYPFTSTGPPSDEFQTWTQCSDSRCDGCQTYDAQPYTSGDADAAAICDSCFYYVNFYEEGKQFFLDCELCDTTFPNCMQCDPDNPDNCLSCNAGFYLGFDENGSQVCSTCNDVASEANGCARCDDSGCLECQVGFYLGTDATTGLQSCQPCDLTAFNSQYGLFEPTRCLQCVTGSPTECLYCEVGYLNSGSNPASCELKCDGNQYPTVIYEELNDTNKNENVIEQTTCNSCPSECASCVGSDGSTQCTSCADAQYLEIRDFKYQTGICRDRVVVTETPVIDIYVSNQIPSTLLTTSDFHDLLAQSTIGEVGNPFYNFEDALIRAKEKAGYYASSVTAEVNIHLMKGTHYVINDRGSTLLNYKPVEFKTTDALNYKLTILPLSCDIVTDANQCVDDSSEVVTIQNKKRERFTIEVPFELNLQQVKISSIDSILYSTTDISCLSERRQCCQVSGSTFSNVYTSDTFSCADAFTNLVSSMEFDCFANWPRSMFQMRLNSRSEVTSPNLVTFNKVQITNTFYAMNSLIAFTDIWGQVEIRDSTFSNLSICGAILKNTFSSLGSAPDISGHVNSIYLSNDQVVNMEAVSALENSLNGEPYSSSYEDVSSLTCDLGTSCFSIKIKGSSFTNIPFYESLITDAANNLVSDSNGLRYQGSILSLDGFGGTVTIETSTFTENKSQYDGCVNVSEFTAQAASLNNFRQLYNPLTDFSTYQLKSLISIQNQQADVAFFSNTFTNNVSFKGLIDIEMTLSSAAVLFKSNTFSANGALIDANLVSLRRVYEAASCGGATFNSNTLKENIGCKDTYGALSLICVDSSDSTLVYFENRDSFFLSDDQFSTLSEQTPSTKTIGNVDNGEEVEVNLYAVTFSGNTVTKNFAGSEKSVISVEGFPTVSFVGDTFADNENFLQTSYIQFSPLYGLQSSTTTPVAETSIDNYSLKARSIVTVIQALSLSLTTVTFTNNWVVDHQSAYSDYQSNGLLVVDFKGSLTMSSLGFDDNRGISGSSSAGINVSPGGFRSQLITFKNVEINSLTFSGNSFSSNQAYYNAVDYGSMQPVLFRFAKEDLNISADAYLEITGLALQSNNFNGADTMIYLSVDLLDVSDLTLKSNIGESLIQVDFPTDTSEALFSTGSISGNTMGQSAIFKVTESPGFTSSKAAEDASVVNMDTFQDVNLRFSEYVFTSNSGSKEAISAKTSCVEIVQTFDMGTANPWVTAEFSDSSFTSNTGKITNEVYFNEIVASITFTGMNWEVASSTSQTREALCIFKDYSSFGILSVINSSFTCLDQDYDDDIILKYDLDSVTGRQSLFKFTNSSNAVEFSNLDPESGENQFPDAISFSNLFSGNTYQDCNNAHEGAIFNLQDGAQVHDTSSEYIKNSALKGGIAYLEGDGTYLKLESPSAMIQKHYAYYGGLIYAIDGAMALLTTNVEVTFCEAYQGVIAYLESRARIALLNTIEVKSSTVYKRGMITALVGSQFWIDDTAFVNNEAMYNSAVIFMESNRARHYQVDGSINFGYGRDMSLMSYFGNSTIERSDSIEGGRLISVIDSALTMDNVVFTENDRSIFRDTFGVHISYSTVVIDQCTFEGSTRSDFVTRIYSRSLKELYGGFIAAYQQSDLTVSNTSFRAGRATLGGCIFVQSDSIATITESTFNECAANKGGAVYASGHQSLMITSSDFQDNIAYQGVGQNIYSASATELLHLELCNFSSYHNSVFTSGLQLVVKDCTFTGDGALESVVTEIPFRVDGGGMYIENTLRVDFDGTNRFDVLRGKYGGAIYLKNEPNARNALRAKAGTSFAQGIFITSVTIENCEATYGGAIYADSPQGTTIYSGQFNYNKAEEEGGAIYYKCDYYNLDDEDLECSFSLSGNPSFTGNEAKIGGGIRWTTIEPEWSIPGDEELVYGPDDTVEYGFLTFQGNTASVYGPEIAGVSRQLIMFDSEDTYLRYYEPSSISRQVPIKNNKRTFQSQYQFKGVQSGGFVPTSYFGLIDKYGQIVLSDGGKEIEFVLMVENKKDQKFQTEIIGVTDFYSAYGTFNMSGMGVIAEPDVELPVELRVKAIDLTLPSNKIYVAKGLDKPINSPDDYWVNIDLIVRPCIQGEGLKESGACFKCPQGSFLLEAPSEPTDCIVCPKEQAICLGGTHIGPRPGYWRKSETASKFIPCPEGEEVCLGMDKNLPQDFPGNAVGLCNTTEGYYGALCSGCLPGYKRVDTFGCAPCSPYQIYITIVIFTLLLFGLSFLIKGTLANAKKDNTHSVFNKILMNHMQMLLITASFDLDWPEEVNDIFELAAPIKEVTNAIVSFDCFMDTRALEDVEQYKFYVNEGETWRTSFQKLLINAFLPILCTIASYTVWGIVCKYKRESKDWHQTRFIATLVLLMFLVHPSITQGMLDMFNCQDYDGELRLQVDLQVICFEGFHSIIAWGLAAPCLILWSLGIPACVYVMMAKEKDYLSTENAKMKFGFLYNGYKRHNYFWEIVIMYRKIFCIFIAVFLNRIGIVVQALVLLILLVMFLQVNSSRRPFLARSLNDIENLSLITQIITIYCGIFFISAKDVDSESYNVNKDFYLDKSRQYFFFIIIALSNVAFIILWIIKFVEIYRKKVKTDAPQLYIKVFLCGREEKWIMETAKMARLVKKEAIIENIESCMLFMATLKNLYVNNIYYEDHNRYLRLLYYIETEKAQIDLTPKRHNHYIQGEMARYRKYDRERQKEVNDEKILDINEGKVIDKMLQQRPAIVEKKLSIGEKILKIQAMVAEHKAKMAQRTMPVHKLFPFKEGEPEETQRTAIGAEDDSLAHTTKDAIIQPQALPFTGNYQNDSRMDEEPDDDSPLQQIKEEMGVYAIDTQAAPNQVNVMMQALSQIHKEKMFQAIKKDEETQNAKINKQDRNQQTPGGNDGKFQPKKRKKQNQPDLEAFVFKSRNMKDQIRSEKKTRIDLRAITKEGTMKPDALPDHLSGFAPGYEKRPVEEKEEGAATYVSPRQNDVKLESIDAHNEYLYEMRQLTDRLDREAKEEAEAKRKIIAAQQEDKPTEVEEQKKSPDSPRRKSTLRKPQAGVDIDKMSPMRDQHQSEVRLDFSSAGFDKIPTKKSPSKTPMSGLQRKETLAMLKSVFGTQFEDDSYDIHASMKDSPEMKSNRADRLLEGLDEIEHTDSCSSSAQSGEEYTDKKLTSAFKGKSLNKNVIITQKGGGGRPKRLRPTSNRDHETVEVSKDELEITILNDEDELVDLPIYNWNRNENSSSMEKSPSPAKDLTKEFLAEGDDQPLPIFKDTTKPHQLGIKDDSFRTDSDMQEYNYDELDKTEEPFGIGGGLLNKSNSPKQKQQIIGPGAMFPDTEQSKDNSAFDSDEEEMQLDESQTNMLPMLQQINKSGRNQ